ncbi:MAG: cytochrome b/b6 domain-containing protein [Bdellovibrionales bacterium]|nr:cytochrome b/b6 domain-containing protein [Bdellovibrionales bacterium]
MLFFTFGLAFTGIQMAQGNNKEFFEEIHELFANAFVITVVAHIGGVIFHTLRHKDPIALSMVTGQKTSDGNEPAIQSSRPVIAILFLILIAAFGVNLVKNYDSTTQKLNAFGLSLCSSVRQRTKMKMMAQATATTRVRVTTMMMTMTSSRESHKFDS